jgi:hypothetical protein
MWVVVHASLVLWQRSSDSHTLANFAPTSRNVLHIKALLLLLLPKLFSNLLPTIYQPSRFSAPEKHMTLLGALPRTSTHPSLLSASNPKESKKVPDQPNISACFDFFSFGHVSSPLTSSSHPRIPTTISPQVECLPVWAIWHSCTVRRGGQSVHEHRETNVSTCIHNFTISLHLRGRTGPTSSRKR